ncbi:MAG TPA: NEW3 domain-containing protein, partial [Candidatus Thermoplasmatota archaeon]|nr:NEW3 domain-containing protein [Candidatus Thermoplasmatota archaeon]
MSPRPVLLAFLVAATALGATVQAQAPTPPALPLPDVWVESVAGVPPQWVNGTATNTALLTTVVNRGEQPAHYTLSYEWVGADGSVLDLNEDPQASQDISSSPSDRRALGPGETRTHDPFPWRLQQGQQGSGWVRVTVQSGHERVQLTPFFIPVHQLALAFGEGDLSLRPGETGFLRATLRNLGNMAANATVQILDAERREGPIDNTQLRKTLDPLAVRVAPQAEQRVTLFVERAFELDVARPFAAQFTLRAATPLLSVQAVSPVTRSNDTAGGFPPGFAFSLQAPSMAVRFVAPGAQTPVAFQLANLADASSAPRRDDTYRVTATASEGWTATPASLLLGLRPGETQPFEVTVRPPAGAPSGSRATLTVTAVSDHTLAAQPVEVPLQAGGPAVRMLGLKMASGAPYVGQPDRQVTR